MEKNEEPKSGKWREIGVCPRGHERTPDNIYRRPNGWEMCRACLNARQRAYHQRKREARRPTREAS
jgi:hypothetical protein